MSELKPRPIPVALILDKLERSREQKKYAFKTEYGTDNPKMGFDKRRYHEELKPMTEEERWKSYFNS